MAEVTETVPVSGFRCERCATRLAVVLEGHEGLLGAHGNLLGEITLTWDDARTSREELVAAMARGGFHEIAVASVTAE